MRPPLFPCSILLGKLAKKYAAEKLIALCIAAYFGIAVFAMFLQYQWQFWMLAVLVGMIAFMFIIGGILFYIAARAENASSGR